MRILLTGSTGFVGSHLLEKLIQMGIPTAILVRDDSNFWRISKFLNEVTVIKMDLEKKYLGEIQEFNPSVLFNLAWYGAENQFNNDDNQFEINLSWTRLVFDIAKQAKIKTILSVGSVAEYGVVHAPVNEQSPILPSNLYGAAKVAAHHLLRVLCDQNNIRLIWVRQVYSYGPMDNMTRLFSYLICELLQKKSPRLTKGEQYWDYVYVTDIAEAMLGLVQDTEAHGVYNLGFGQAYQIRHIAEVIRDQIDSSINIEFGAKPYRADQSTYLQADSSKLQHQTGWVPKVSLEEGVRKATNWFRNQILIKDNEVV